MEGTAKNDLFSFKHETLNTINKKDSLPKDGGFSSIHSWRPFSAFSFGSLTEAKALTEGLAFYPSLLKTFYYYHDYDVTYTLDHFNLFCWLLCSLSHKTLLNLVPVSIFMFNFLKKATWSSVHLNNFFEKVWKVKKVMRQTMSSSFFFKSLSFQIFSLPWVVSALTVPLVCEEKIA